MRNLKATIFAIAVFGILVGIFYFFWTVGDRTVLARGKVQIGAAFAFIALFTVFIFQSFRVSESATELALRYARQYAKSILASSPELFAQLYRNSPVPYILLEKDGVISSTNMSAVRLFMTEEGALEGKNLFTLLDSDDPQRVGLLPGKLAQGVFVNDSELRVLRMDGATSWVLFSLFSFVDTEGSRRGLATLVDISKQKQVDKAKSEFVSLASHQLRTPIASMEWNLELLVMKHNDTLSSEERTYIEKARASVDQMKLLLDDFLNVSRFELGTLVAQKTTFSLNQLIEALIAETIERATAKRVSILSELDPALGAIVSDTHLLRMVIGNIIGNAVKYTPEGGKVTVRSLQNENNIVITVADTGIGIPKEELDHLFTKIFRASNAQALVPDGTGLGLYIAEQAVKIVGGKITVQSEQNVGTTFTITLPA